MALVRAIVLPTGVIVPLDAKPESCSAYDFANVAKSAQRAIIRQTLAHVWRATV